MLPFLPSIGRKGLSRISPSRRLSVLLSILSNNVAGMLDACSLTMPRAKVGHFVSLRHISWLSNFQFYLRFKWSLFKTLEYLNSRKEDVELEPAFFEQLTSFSQKLQERGLIRSKTWTLTQGMSDEEIILNNTFCNSKNKFNAYNI